MEGAGQCKLTQLVSDHVFRHVDWDEFLAIMDRKRESDEIRKDRRTTGPRFDHVLVFAGFRSIHLFQEVVIAEGTFFN